jgi:hypothetical protein
VFLCVPEILIEFIYNLFNQFVSEIEKKNEDRELYHELKI